MAALGTTSTSMEDELRDWLRRRVQSGQLLVLPIYRDPEGIPRRPERYARGLLADLAAIGPSAAAGSREVTARASAFRTWADRQPRGRVAVRRSNINLAQYDFPTLRPADEIHDALENLAHPDPGRGPGFREIEARPRKRGAACRDRKPVRSQSARALHSYALILIALTISTSVFVALMMMAQRHGPGSVVEGSLFLTFGILALALGLVSRQRRRPRPQFQPPHGGTPGAPMSDAKPLAARGSGPLHDPWLDGQPISRRRPDRERDQRR